MQEELVENRDDFYWETLKYLLSAKESYRGGVPLGDIERSVSEFYCADLAAQLNHWQEADLLFVAPVGKEQGGASELLQRAITEGLKLELGEVAVLYLVLQQGKVFCSSELRQSLAEQLKRLKVKIIVVCGLEGLTLLGSNSEELKRGEWQKALGCEVLLTHGLTGVIGDRAIKREFWYDLQSVLQRLSGDKA